MIDEQGYRFTLNTQGSLEGGSRAGNCCDGQILNYTPVPLLLRLTLVSQSTTHRNYKKTLILVFEQNR